MKHLAIILSILFSSIFVSSCHIQKMMQTMNDAEKIRENELYFRDKPLKVLLKEIKPEIKMVSANGSSSFERLAYFVFKFVNEEEYKKYAAAGKTPISIRVMLKEGFVWNKPREDLTKWTKQDAKKYGDLVIAYIRVYGENLIKRKTS